MSFNKTVQDMRDGQLLGMLSDKLNDVVEAVQEHGKAGELTLKLVIKPNGDDAVTVSPKVTVKAPEATVGDAIFFVSGGNLVRRNPRQGDIEDEIARKRIENDSKVEAV